MANPTKRPLLNYVGWKGVGILALAVETFARTGSVAATASELRFGNDSALSDFLFRIVGIPRGPHGGKRPHPDERIPYRHPSADCALRVWRARRREVLALYAKPDPLRKYSDDAVRRAFAKAGTVMGASRIIGSGHSIVSRRLDVLGIPRPGKAEATRIGQAAKRAQAVTE